MKRTVLGVCIVAAAIYANPAFATKTDYCAAYARDFADAQSSDKTLWQHKYDIANQACLAESKATVQASQAKPKAKKPPTDSRAAVPAEPKATPTAESDKIKLEPGSENWNSYCTNKYTSFNAKTGTYTSRTGKERKCVVTYP